MSKLLLSSVIPAVDILGTEAVRLVRGSYDDVSVREPDPFALVAQFAGAGAKLIHVVDLTGARSGRSRPDVIRRAVEAAGPAQIQASGGVRTIADTERLLAAGVARVVVGTAAFTGGDLLERLVERLGDRLVVALDVRGGMVAVRGWEHTTPFTTRDAIRRCLDVGVPRILCTAIDRDGTLGGPDLDLLAQVVSESQLPVLAAGGITSLEDVDAIAAVGCEAAIVGRALLEGRLSQTALDART